MIVVHNVRGEPFAINAQLIERVEGGAETHVLLVDGSRYIVTEAIDEVVDLVRHDRAQVEAEARRLVVRNRTADEPESVLRLLSREDRSNDGEGG
jgi:uncharacterized protein YlzI (FlbEa/FlbD family)